MKKEFMGYVVAAIFTIGVLGSIAYINSQKDFPQTHIAANTITGYETTPGYWIVSPSPACAWSLTSSGLKVAGFIFVVIMWVGAWLVTTERVQSGHLLFYGIPLLISLAFLLGGFEVKLNKTEKVTEQVFNSTIDLSTLFK